MVAFLAFCCGAVVANLYYAQPIVELIAPQIGLSSANASLIVSLTQFGYALGLLLLVPLADLMENRRLVVGFTLAASVTLLCAGLTHSPSLFLLLSLLIGLTSVAVQILVPLAAHLAPEASRGRVVGNIMSGLLLGILLSRPLSSLLVEVFGWRGVFYSAAALMAVIALITAVALPRRVPTHKATYVALIGSVFALARRFPVLRQRSLYQGLLFASFSLFWTLAPIELMRHRRFQPGAGGDLRSDRRGGCDCCADCRASGRCRARSSRYLVALLLAPLSLCDRRVAGQWLRVAGGVCGAAGFCRCS